MELFIGNLPSDVSLGEVIALFKGFSSKGRFHLKQKKLEDGTVIRFVVAEFESDKYALKLIEKFAGAPFRGRELVIREYMHRSYNNERRAVNWRDKPWRAGERRRSDRRLKEFVAQRDEFEELLASSRGEEPSEEEQIANLKVQAYDNFARKN